MKNKLTYLLTTIAFLAISSVAMAQDGKSPYAGTSHNYSVTPDADATNKTYLWSVSGGGTINGAADGTSVTIDWGTTLGTYTVTFTEKDESTSCSTIRELEVEVISNTFYLNMFSDASACHDSTGLILASGASGPTTLYFTVNLNKDNAWSIDTWEYDFSVSVDGSDYSLSSVKVDDGAELGTGGSYSDISVTGTESTSEIAVVIDGPVTAGTNVTVTISNGEAIKGVVVTPDNGSGDKTQILTLNPLPNTTDITTD
ncbi:hypothetical protein SLH46_02095 [Draconibacterium sp. IB214405]|uniref:hypothetical protein n=1 Tax=Draconibacterium sp. IB214405 TaxID=3097352 RepID=UPI002A0C9124|nr:hypothetical protein [Draconibacterium sp. IB214405]MDX8337955.1 hypothetical protein [Draconibacterium sp. IB214405]